MSLKYLSLVTALAAASPASAITLNMSDFTYGSPTTVAVTGTDGAPSYEGAAGEFTGSVITDALMAGPLAALALTSGSPESFTAWCGELTQTFSFGETYVYSQMTGVAAYGSVKATELSQLFTAAQGFVVDSRTSAAMQAGIWEILYENGQSFSLTGGNFTGHAGNAADQAALDVVDGFLANLSGYQATYHIDVLASDDHQNFIVATVPEPETWALLVAGLGAIGVLRRRRKS